ncbi:MAG: GNAT family N-acetyltransferase [Burkholderiaceae bacterium]
MPLTAPPLIETPRLHIRLVTESDLPALLTFNGDDEVTRFLPYATWKSMDDARAWLKRMQGFQDAGGTLQFVVVDRQSALAIGTCLLFKHEEASARAELGYVLARSHWGGGVMREALTALINHAFTHMALRRLEAEIDPRNVASGRLLARLGFVHEGTLRQRWMTKGELSDSGLYGLLQDDWLTRTALGAR